MVGQTLVEIRAHIESLASDDGAYHLLCARTGDRPIPAIGKRFPDRETARRAARATEQYRAALREYDQRVPYRDVIACEDGAIESSGLHVDCRIETDWSLSEPILAGRAPEPDRRRRVSFCHDVAAAVFEALSAGGYDQVESGVMEAYFDLAEDVSDADDLCLRLLECLAVELDAGLGTDEQVAVLTNAASRLGLVEDHVDPLAATFARFRHVGFVDGYEQSPWTTDRDGTRSAAVEVAGYPLGPRGGRLPVLPIVLGLYRRQLEGHLTEIRAVRIREGWQIAIELCVDGRPKGQVSAPIEGAV